MCGFSRLRAGSIGTSTFVRATFLLDSLEPQPAYTPCSMTPTHDAVAAGPGLNDELEDSLTGRGAGVELERGADLGRQAAT